MFNHNQIRTLVLMLGVLFSSQLFSQVSEHIVVSDSQEVAEVFVAEVVITGHTHQDALPTLKHSNRSTEEHLEEISGLSLIRRGNYAAEPTYRGLNSSQTSVTIDGMKIFGACTDKMDPVTSYVAPDNLAKASMNESSDGHAACNIASLDLKTHDLKLSQQKPKGFIRSGYNTNGGGAQFAGELHFGRAKRVFRIQSFYTSSENYGSGGNKEISFTQFEKWNGSIQMKQKVGTNAILNFKYIADRARDIGYPALPMDVSRANGDVLSIDYKQALQRKFIKTVKLKVYGNSIYHEMDDSKRADVAMHMDMPGWSSTSGIFGVAAIEIGRSIIKIKPEYYWSRSYAEMTMYPDNEATMFMLTWPDVRRSSSLMSINHKFKSKSKLELNNSAQLELQQNRLASDLGLKQLRAIGYKGSDINGRYGVQLNSQLNYPLGGKQRVIAKVAATQRFPNVTEQFGYYLFNSLDLYDYLGNPKLKNEQSLLLELAYAVQTDHISLKFQAYAYHFQNYILGLNTTYDAMTFGALGVRSYSNIDNASITGIELEAQIKITKKWFAKSQNSYTHGVDNLDRPLPLIPSGKSINQLTYKGSLFSGNIRFTHSFAQNNSADYYGERKTESYNLFDINIEKEIKLSSKIVRFELSMQNVTDTYYSDHLDWNKIPRMGRSVNISLKYQF
jgi:iron complex outermembrane recepter protein